MGWVSPRVLSRSLSGGCTVNPPRGIPPSAHPYPRPRAPSRPVRKPTIYVQRTERRSLEIISWKFIIRIWQKIQCLKNISISGHLLEIYKRRILVSAYACVSHTGPKQAIASWMRASTLQKNLIMGRAKWLCREHYGNIWAWFNEALHVGGTST